MKNLTGHIFETTIPNNELQAIILIEQRIGPPRMLYQTMNYSVSDSEAEEC